jgi:hypothetical protein
MQRENIMTYQQEIIIDDFLFVIFCLATRLLKRLDKFLLYNNYKLDTVLATDALKSAYWCIRKGGKASDTVPRLIIYNYAEGYT